MDRVYMTFVQATTGSGGWPMSVWLTPDLQPFYGGTYFPPTVAVGAAGLRRRAAGRSRARGATERDAGRGLGGRAVTDRLRDADRAAPGPATVPDAERARAHASRSSARRSTAGAAASATRRSSRGRASCCSCCASTRAPATPAPRDMVLRTLRAMALGGMRDHVGGGFHRYSVDADWRVPHFEKMLYDQAQLVLAYLEAAQVSRRSVLRRESPTTRWRYVDARDDRRRAAGSTRRRTPTASRPEQAGVPGAHKIGGRVLPLDGRRDSTRCSATTRRCSQRRFGIEAGRQRAGRSAGGVHRQEPALRGAVRSTRSRARPGRAAGEPWRTRSSRARMALFEARLARPAAASRRQGAHRLERPDDRRLRARRPRAARGRARRIGRGVRRRHLAAAQRAARFLRETMWDAERQVLLRRYRDGEAAIDGYAEDYACLIFGLLELFQADGDPGWLEWAAELQQRQDDAVLGRRARAAGSARPARTRPCWCG